MRTKLKITEGIFPMPVLMVATYNEDGSVNVMNAAWGTMQERDTVALNLTETHKTVQNIKARGAFTVSIADAAHMVEADFRCDLFFAGRNGDGAFVVVDSFDFGSRSECNIWYSA